jgi:hypothetical protein
VGSYLLYHIGPYGVDRDNFTLKTIRLMTGVNSHKASVPLSILTITCLYSARLQSYY